MAKITITIKDGTLNDLKGLCITIDGEPESPKHATIAQLLGMTLVEEIPEILRAAGAKNVMVHHKRGIPDKSPATRGLN